MGNLGSWFSTHRRTRRFWIRHPWASGAFVMVAMLVGLGFFAVRGSASNWWTWFVIVGASAATAAIIAVINRNERDMRARQASAGSASH